jgi:hypothetical protein
MNPLPAPVSAPLAPKVVGTTSAVPIEAPATAMPRSPASTAPATIAPAAMATLPASLPAYAVTSLPAPPVVVAQGPGTVMAAAHDPPQILDVNLSTREIHGGDTVFGRVRTSSNVASVEARVEGYSSSLPKVVVGEFAIAYKVPPMIPFYLQHTYSLHLIARNVDGAQATRDLSVSLR